MFQLLSKVWGLVDGNKRYIGLIAAGIFGILWSCGVLTDHQVEVIGMVVGTWTGVGFVNGQKKAVAATTDLAAQIQLSNITALASSNAMALQDAMKTVDQVRAKITNAN